MLFAFLSMKAASFIVALVASLAVAVFQISLFARGINLSGKRDSCFAVTILLVLWLTMVLGLVVAADVYFFVSPLGLLEYLGLVAAVAAITWFSNGLRGRLSVWLDRWSDAEHAKADRLRRGLV